MNDWGASFNERNLGDSLHPSPAATRGAHSLLSRDYRKTELRIVASLPMNPQMFDMGFVPRRRL
jgi:hypothetical protein